MKLLLIDDNELDRQAIIRTFKKSEWDITIAQACSASEGLAQFDSDDFDAVLLDYRLPDIDGMEVLHLLAKHPHHHAAVIILTGASADEDLEREFIEAGAQDVLFKSEIAHKHLTRAITHARARHELEHQLHESHQRLRALAENDSLTGLANRYYFDESLRAAIQRARRQQDQLALLFLDLDNFKFINDGLGHLIGDQVLQEVAKRLVNVVRAGDVVCRLGGDEFAILAHNFESQEAISQLAQRILDDLRQPIVVGNNEHRISSSIGIATYPDAGENASDLLKAADMAMYRAKQDGRDNFQFFSPAMQAQMQERLHLEKELRALIPTDHFVLFYQPIVDAQTFEVCGAEGLIRWDHPERGILPPSEFISLAEEIGLISEIDSRSRLNACKQLAKWRQQGLVNDDFNMKFNVCAQLLTDEDLYRGIIADLTTTGLPGSCVSLEITESILIENLTRTAQKLQQMRDYGIDIAVDDFGTGYSSIAYLKELPARTLKIDRKFVQNIPDNLADCRILRAMIVFAKSLDLIVVVEGVETREQARICRDYGADLLQGYLFSKPLPPVAFEQFLHNHNAIEWTKHLSVLGILTG
ncbi:GGDEF domain-containing response regulator [Cellvibrio mixtus]|jgi:diguanylate cyclase (GGDEF)-like protein|uniref:GGDEF domain-containing response regulator n=1 Tax=Cellvibrio mixtus TaxID=39650 RepID=A0A266Q9F1_9GAMM|nr:MULTISPECIES: GGDEF domain-containing response regulator [Cellvibrio]AQT59996.1 GGDEF domain-containing response regulator [Cellvibrio sp. PSBB023]OZY85991.1 GGDEF domain-containing response regulator [Cellvibrio mixtus]